MPFTIRLFAYSALSCLMLSGIARAEVDFNTLLAQLPSLDSEDEGLLESEIDAELLIPEEEITTPPGEVNAISPSDLIEPPSVESRDYQGRTLGGPPDDANETPSVMPSSATPSENDSAPHSILETDPEQAPAQATIDFQRMFEAQNNQPTDVAMAYDTTPTARPCGCQGMQHYCQPHRRPSLPPPATLESMYHCKPCYRDVWAGYEADRQKECEKLHKHLHGRCDCFKPKCQAGGPVLYPSAPCTQAPSLFSRMFHKVKPASCDCPHEAGADCDCGE